VKITSLIIVYLLLNTYLPANDTKRDLTTYLNNGDFAEIVNQCNVQLINAETDSAHFVLYELLAQAYLELNYLPAYLRTIELIKQVNPNKALAKALYHTQRANYYHYMLITDSAVFNSMQALKLLKRNMEEADSNMISRVYACYGNVNRNLGPSNLNHNLTPYKSNDLVYRKILLNYLDTALSYATNNFRRADILQKKANVLGDIISPAKVYSCDSVKPWAYEKSFNCHKKALLLSSAPAKQARSYSLMGLSTFYFRDYKSADSLFTIADSLLIQGDSIKNLYAYMINQKWRGWNLDKLYEQEQRLELLCEATRIYEESLSSWSVYYTINAQKNKGLHDGYSVGVNNKLAANYYRLFQETGDSSFINKSFQAAENSKYRTNPFQSTTLYKLQEVLDSNTAFIQAVSSRIPIRSYYFVITKKTIDFLDPPPHKKYLSVVRQSNLYRFKDLKFFKKTSNAFYEAYFKKVDSLLKVKGISNVVISNSDRNSMLNYDLLISDTSGTSWRDLTYLFHRYNFSYALNAQSYVNSLEHDSPSLKHFGVTLGKYSSDVNLRFSAQLTELLENDFKADITDFESNISEYKIGILLAHGDANFFEQNGKIKITSKIMYSASQLFDKNLNNELFIITACSSNKSRQWNGEGATANFSKAFRYAGTKSTITTSWEIDDKTNALILENFFENIAKGLPKNKALWKAKKHYWHQAKQDEEFKPLYWAPYILMGNERAIKLTKNPRSQKYWLLVLVPTMIAGIRLLQK